MAGINGWESVGNYYRGNAPACEQCKTCKLFWIDGKDYRCMTTDSSSVGGQLAGGNATSGNCKCYTKGKPKKGKPNYGKTKVKCGPCSICQFISSCFQGICSCLRCCGVRGNIMGWDV